MATSVQPIYPGFNTDLNGIQKRQQLEILRGQLELERASFITHWRDLNNYLAPRRGRFQLTDVNKGDRRGNQIIDSTASLALRTLAAGMMSGITSPSRPWFRLSTSDPEVAEQDEVKWWLHEVTSRMQTAFIRSNFYNALPTLYKDMGGFGTATMIQLEDDAEVFRFYPFPIGSYCVGNDAANRVRIFSRVFRKTVQQIIEQWGELDSSGKPAFERGQKSRISLTVQRLWESGNTQAWVDLAHVIRPNYAYDSRKIESQYKTFNSCYYELGSPNQPIDPKSTGLLADEGFDEFPVFCVRWETNAEDVYATDCPGMSALGDIRQLQTGEKRSLQAVEKMINPPMQGPPHLRSVKSSILPGDITIYQSQSQFDSFRPVHEINFDVAKLEEKQEQVRARINESFYVTLFRMLDQLDPKDVTAYAISQMKEEKLLALGPVLEQMNQDLLDPVIDRSFNIMYRKGLIPDPPEQLQGMPLRVEYISIMAQAQKAVGVGSMERLAGFATGLAEVRPDILDGLDVDEMLRDYAEMTGVPPKSVIGKERLEAIRDARAKQQQMAEAQANLAQASATAKNLAASPLDGDTALSRLLGKSGSTAGTSPAGLSSLTPS